MSYVTVEMFEQPASKPLRFRYTSEGRAFESIPGASSTESKKTYPAICVQNYTGEGIIVVSCVTKERPYRPHPHSLVGKRCTKGVCRVDFKSDSSTPTVITFPSLGIQCAKRTETDKMLTEREFLRIDPFKTGFKHKNKPKFLDLNSIRLCFQVLIKPAPTFNMLPLKPIVSDPINDKKAAIDLIILDISDTTSPTIGGKKIMIFCEKVQKDDIKIRFFQDSEYNSWEGWGDFLNVHRQTAIAFKTPKYKMKDIDSPVNAFMQLLRPSDNVQSEPLPFQYIPDVTNINLSTKRKKLKILEGKELFSYVQMHEEDKRQNAKMDVNIEPNRDYSQNIPKEERQQRSFASNFDFPANNHVQPQSNTILQQHSIQQSHQNYQIPSNPPPNTSYPESNLCSNFNPHQYYFNSHQQQLYDPMPNSHYSIPTSEPTTNWNLSRPTQIDQMDYSAGSSQALQYPIQCVDPLQIPCGAESLNFHQQPLNTEHIYGPEHEHNMQQFCSNNSASVDVQLNVMDGPVTTAVLRQI